MQRRLILAGLLALTGACSGPPPEPETTGELEIHLSSQVIAGVPQRVLMYERRDFGHGGRPDYMRSWPQAAECLNDECVVTIDQQDLIVTPKVGGRVRLRARADGYNKDWKTFELDARPARLAVFYDPEESIGAVDAVAPHTTVTWRVGLQEAELATAEGIHPIPTTARTTLVVREGDATAKHTTGSDGYETYAITFGAPGPVTIDAAIGPIQRTLSVEVFDPAEATSLELHAMPTPDPVTAERERRYRDVEVHTAFDAGPPVESLDLAYPDGHAFLAPFVRDARGRFIPFPEVEVAVSPDATVVVQQDPRALRLYPYDRSGLGATTIRCTVGFVSTTLRAVVR